MVAPACTVVLVSPVVFVDASGSGAKEDVRTIQDVLRFPSSACSPPCPHSALETALGRPVASVQYIGLRGGRGGEGGEGGREGGAGGKGGDSGGSDGGDGNVGGAGGSCGGGAEGGKQACGDEACISHNMSTSEVTLLSIRT